jgi:hypothetical protein
MNQYLKEFYDRQKTIKLYKKRVARKHIQQLKEAGKICNHKNGSGER